MEDAGFARGGQSSDLMANVVARVAEVSQAVTRALRKATRRTQAIAGDLAAIDDADAWAARAPWLVAEAAKAPPGTKSLRVPDWSNGSEAILEFPLDPARSARVQVDALFAEARRLRRARARVVERLERATADEAKVRSLLDDLQTLRALASEPGTDAVALGTELATLEERARAILPRGAALPGEKAQPLARKPYRDFVVADGLHVLVGRDAKDNDELTLHVAKPHHVWLHAKGHTGSHVIACIGKGHTLTSEQLVDAAHLAVHFSDARGETVVEVSYLPKRYVRKPRKSPPGLVVLDREKVLVLRVDAERMARLLAGP